MGTGNGLCKPVPCGVCKYSAMDWRKIIGSPFCDLPSGQKHTLTTLARYGDQWGSDIFPSQRSLAFRAGVSQKSVTNTMQRAENEGWIIRHSEGGRRGYKRHTYELAVPAGLLGAVELFKSNFWEPPYTHQVVRQSARIFLVKRPQT